MRDLGQPNARKHAVARRLKQWRKTAQAATIWYPDPPLSHHAATTCMHESGSSRSFFLADQDAPNEGTLFPTSGDSKNLIPINIEDEMKRSYLDYAMSVIIGRALP